MESRRSTPLAASIELPTPQDMAVADTRAVTGGTSVETLMERAGCAVAEVAAEEARRGTSIAVLAGPGNNGGDAFVAARVLRERGYRTVLADLSGGAGGPAARQARQRYHGPRVTAEDERVAGADCIVDGLFGGGLSRDLDGPLAALVARVNGSAARVVAIDLPSGIDGATGAVRGCAIHARRTVTFQRRKPGHLLLPGRLHSGRVSVVDIGIPDAVLASLAVRTFANEPPLWRAHRPRLSEAGHKYDRGHAVVVSGPMSQTGAARLAATAALRAGAGLVTLASPPDALAINAAHLTTVMLAPVADAAALSHLLADSRRNAICLGPGLPPQTARPLVEAALAAPAAAVLDAGAITAFAGEAEALAGAIGGGTAVLTPHEGEFARVFASDGDKLVRAREAAAMSGAVVVLKGPDTVIAAPDGRAAINANAPAWLATAGTGDVLAGLVTAFLAQGVPAFEAAAMAVHLHGETAHLAGPALVADDLLASLQRARAAFDTL